MTLVSLLDSYLQALYTQKLLGAIVKTMAQTMARKRIGGIALRRQKEKEWKELAGSSP